MVAIPNVAVAANIIISNGKYPGKLTGMYTITVDR
jgi:hypothetical protein